MTSKNLFASLCLTILISFCLAGCQGVVATSSYTLTVAAPTSGAGTITSNPAGINCPSTCSASYVSGTSVTLTAAPATGYTFTGWSGSCSGNNTTCTVTLSAAANVSATFSNEPGLTVTITGSGTVTSSPAGINCSSGSCAAVFAPGTQVTLTATAGTGADFTGWGGACSGTSTCVVTVTAATSVTANFGAGITLSVTLAGSAAGTVTSSPGGINCTTGTCTASFPSGTQVTLTESPSTGNTFSGWSGSCTGTATTCVLTLTAPASTTATFGVGGTINSLNHIILFAQENRSLDHYFGQMTSYWAANGYGTSGQTFNGLPAGGVAEPGCPPGVYGDACGDSTPDPNNAVTSFHFQSVCQENQSPFWNEAHNQWNFTDPAGTNGTSNPPLNGFVMVGAYDAQGDDFMDVAGDRSMGYFDGDDLNYYYWLASNFATSDMWFAPVMSRTQINRMYMLGATSQGRAYPQGGGNPNAVCGGGVLCSNQLTAPPIFEALQNAGVSWKIYVNPQGTACDPNEVSDPNGKCLLSVSYLNMFSYEGTVINSAGQNPDLLLNIVPINQYGIDVANGTLPSFAYIEPASNAGLDEHPSDYDEYPVNVQDGQQYVANTIINPLMQSVSWHDSALIFTFDEWGGYYDHVPPQPAVVPASGSGDFPYPVDLIGPPNPDVCMKSGETLGQGMCSFGWTGFRVPLIVISPFSLKNGVSHTVHDTTSVLQLVEQRFGVSNLTQRDLKQNPMAAPGDFFDFVNVPWATPPTPSQIPTPSTGGTCDLVPPASWNDPAVLTVDVSGPGSVSSMPTGINECTSDCEYTFTSGTSVTLTATPASGHTFTGWGNGNQFEACNGSTSPTCSVSMAGATETTAIFQ